MRKNTETRRHRFMANCQPHSEFVGHHILTTKKALASKARA